MPAAKTKAKKAKPKAGMGSHQKSRMDKDEWLTPPEILKPLGGFDLDPCAAIKMPWPTASRHLTKEDDGLANDWEGRIWLNPPYGAETTRWMERIARHQSGTALIFARTETKAWFEWVWPYATAILFLKGRLHFHHVDGTKAKDNGGAPSALVAYGKQDARVLESCGLAGHLVWLPNHVVSLSKPAA